MTVHTSRFGLKWNYAPHDTGWGDDYNFAHREIAALLHCYLISNVVTTPPVSPAEDDAYLVPVSATGAWSTQTGKIAAYQGGAWQYYTPYPGMRAYIANLDGFYWWDGGAWHAEATSSGGTFVETVAGHAPVAGDVSLVVGDITGAAPLSSPAFTGTPTAPTQAAHNNSTRIATTAYVDGAISALGGVVSLTAGTGITLTGTSAYTISVNTSTIATRTYVDSAISTLVGSAGSTMDTLGEIATLLASDESTAAALATTVAGKVAKAGDTMTGDLHLAAPGGSDNTDKAVSSAWVRTYVTGLGYGTGSGTVTSVDLTMPTLFSVTGNPVTGSGTLAVALATQTANRVLAGPTTGSAAAPTFRALVTADMPAGTGTVTSVGLTMPSDFSVGSSPVTGSGTIAVTRTTQSANLVQAGPSTGSPATPTYRSLVAADLPSGIGSNIPYDIGFFAEGVLTTSEVVARFVCPRALSLASGASGVAICGVAPTGATAVMTLTKNGSSFGTVTYATGSTVGTVSITDATSFAIGDIIGWVGPASVDATLSDVSATLTATRS